MTRQPILAITFALMGGLVACTQQDYAVTVSPYADPVIAAKAAPASAGKVALCHITDNAAYNLINVSANAEAAHLAHGDKAAPVGAETSSDCVTPEPPPVDICAEALANAGYVPNDPYTIWTTTIIGGVCYVQVSQINNEE